MQNNQEVIDFLVENGFRINNKPILTDAIWTAYKIYEGETEECVCNDKNPQISIEYFSFTHNDKNFESYTIGIVQENDLNWIDFKYYSLKHEDLLELNTYIDGLIRAWEASFR